MNTTLSVLGTIGILAGMTNVIVKRRKLTPKPSKSSNSNSNTNIMTRRADGRPAYYIIINNVAKKANIGTMMRSAAAFGATAMFVVGRKKSTTMFGSFGTNKHMKVIYFDKLHQAVEHAKRLGCTIWGVEIDEKAVSIVSHPFRGSAAFLMGNEGHGLTESERKVIDRYVYIPHHGNGTASLNVTVASSIIFQHYATWAGYEEREFEGQKMVVDPVKLKTAPDADDLKVRAKRKAEREATTEVNTADVFGSGDGGGGGDY
tara:strand:- start:345 stop:1124 length:780 start_codon:yes stop_codon:yes gene_type:complete